MSLFDKIDQSTERTCSHTNYLLGKVHCTQQWMKKKKGLAIKLYSELKVPFF